MTTQTKGKTMDIKQAIIEAETLEELYALETPVRESDHREELHALLMYQIGYILVPAPEQGE